MKCKFSILFILLTFVLLSFSFVGCGIIRKKTIIKTEKTIQIDTVIQIKTDTITIIDSTALKRFLAGDTLKAENKESVAKTFFNPSTQKVELTLKGKIFEVPLKINQKIIERKKEVETKRTYKGFLFFIAGFVLYWICYFAYKLIKFYLK
jgi:hypothetical protein